MTFNEEYTKNDHLQWQQDNIYKWMDYQKFIDNIFSRNMPFGNDNFLELLKDVDEIWKAARAKLFLKMEEEIELLEKQKTITVDKKILGIHRILKSLVFEANTKKHLPISKRTLILVGCKK